MGKVSGVTRYGICADWQRGLIALRVKAIESRIAQKSIGSSPVEGNSPKKARTADVPSTPANARKPTEAVEPPSAIRRMLGYVFPFSSKKAEPTSGGQSKEGRGEAQLMTSFREAQRGSTIGEGTAPVSAFAKTQAGRSVVINPYSPVMVESISKKADIPARPQSTMTTPSASITAPTVNPSSSFVLTHGNSNSYAQRSAAIQAIFSHSSTAAALNTSTSSTHSVHSVSSSVDLSRSIGSASAPISIPRSGNRPRSSVSDLVRSFEDGGVLLGGPPGVRGKGKERELNGNRPEGERLGRVRSNLGRE
jgi:hypothetical protein